MKGFDKLQKREIQKFIDFEKKLGRIQIKFDAFKDIHIKNKLKNKEKKSSMMEKQF
jgi:hypothetical protein